MTELTASPQAQHDPDDVPVTMTLVYLMHLLHHARTVYISETQLAELTESTPPSDWHTRCSNLFHQHAAAADKAGIKQNQITFTCLLDLVERTDPALLDALNNTDGDDLPKRYIFNPWHGIREPP